jgi:hypothetical protein
VPGVSERLFALLGEGEVFVGEAVFLCGAHTIAATGDVLAARPGALHLTRLGDVAPGSFLYRAVAIASLL